MDENLSLISLHFCCCLFEYDAWISHPCNLKNYEANYFFIPVWDQEELKHANANSLLDWEHQQSESELMEKVELAGPIPRFALSKNLTLELLRIDIEAEITSENLLDLLKFVDTKQGVRDNHGLTFHLTFFHGESPD
jgi:hypothetical protein